MSGIILPVLYPILYPIIVYYSVKYVANATISIAINKTKNILWNVVTYPFSNENDNISSKPLMEKE